MYVLPLTLLLIMALAGRCRADGGVLQLSAVKDGTQLSVFTNPGVPAAGLVELSVLVQEAVTHAAVLDADVLATLVPQGDGTRASAWAPPICAATSASNLQSIRLSRSGASNLLYYGATIQIPHGGVWNLRVQVAHQGRTDLVDGTLRVADQAAPWTNYWHLLALPIVAVAGFVCLRRKGRQTVSGLA